MYATPFWDAPPRPAADELLRAFGASHDLAVGASFAGVAVNAIWGVVFDNFRPTGTTSPAPNPVISERGPGITLVNRDGGCRCDCGCGAACPRDSQMIVDRGRVAVALPGYELGGELGSGTFGLVLAGTHRRLGRPVAIKVMQAEGPAGVSTDFAAEARVLAGLDHPHVVRAYDYVEAEGLCFVVMELLPGGTLSRRRDEIASRQACAVGLAVATALEHAHARGILHRDVKADNIMFAADGTVKVTDFGIAKLFEGSATTASGVAGTPMYMAPEQIEGGRLSPATDVYGLGVVLYHLLSGAPPFSPNQPVNQLWRQHLTSPPPPLTGVPAPVAVVILRALAKNPVTRCPDAHTFAVELADAATDAFGPGWASRTGVPLHLDEDTRRATDPPPLPAITLPGADGLVSTVSPTESDGLGSLSPATLTGRRRLLAAALGVGLLGVGFTAGVLTDGLRQAPADPHLAAALGGHTGSVQALAFSPDGSTLATGSSDGSVLLWDVSDPHQIGDLPHKGVVHSVAFSSNGGLLATGASVGDGVCVVQLWDVASAAEDVLYFAPAIIPADKVLAVAISPDGAVVAAVSTAGAVNIWDITYSGSRPFGDPPDSPAAVPVGDPLDNPGAVLSAALSSDGATLATGGLAALVRLWDLSDPTSPSQLGDPIADRSDDVLAVTFSADGTKLATGGRYNGVRLWDVADPAAPARLRDPLDYTEEILGMAISPDGAMIATGGGDTIVRLWAVA